MENAQAHITTMSVEATTSCRDCKNLIYGNINIQRNGERFVELMIVLCEALSHNRFEIDFQNMSR